MAEEEFLFGKVKLFVRGANYGSQCGWELEGHEGENDHPNFKVKCAGHPEMLARFANEFEAESQANKPESGAEEAEEKDGVARGGKEPYHWSKPHEK